jgi:hypothetical protein
MGYRAESIEGPRVSTEEFVEYLIQHDVKPIGDLSKAPLELVDSGVVRATFQSPEEVVSWIERDEADHRDWELRYGFADE